MDNVRERPNLGQVSLDGERFRSLRFELVKAARTKYEAAKQDIRKNWFLYFAVFLVIFLILPSTGFCDVEGTMRAIQNKLVGTILPLAAILGFVFAGLSFVAGSPNARTHLVLAIIGAVVGFGAQSIMEFIKGMVK